MTGDVSAVVSDGDQERLRAAEGLLREWYDWWGKWFGDTSPDLWPEDSLERRTGAYLRSCAPTEERVTATEAARRLGVDRKTVNRWIHAGRLPAVRVGRTFRVPVSAVEAFAQPVTSEPS